MGFYSFAVSLLYFLLAYILSFLRHKTITPKNLVIFKAFGKILLGLFVIFLIYVLMILLNFNLFHRKIIIILHWKRAFCGIGKTEL